MVLEKDEGVSVETLAKITWELASLVLANNVTVVLMYWLLVHEGGVVAY